MDLRDRRDLYNGFGNGLSRAFEFAVTPAVFGGIGYLLDHRLDIVPVFTIVLFLFAMTGMFIRMWFEYDQTMRRHEAERAWAKRPDVSA